MYKRRIAELVLRSLMYVRIELPHYIGYFYSNFVLPFNLCGVGNGRFRERYIVLLSLRLIIQRISSRTVNVLFKYVLAK